MSDSKNTALQSERPDATGRRDFLIKAALVSASLSLTSVPGEHRNNKARPQARPRGSVDCESSGRWKFPAWASAFKT